MARLGSAVIQAIIEIVERGNTAEVKQGKDGIWVAEIKRKMKYTPEQFKQREEMNKSVN